MNTQNINKWKLYNHQIKQAGHTVIPNVYNDDEVNSIIDKIEKSDHKSSTFRKSEDLFAIRQFLKEIPEVKNLIFNENLRTIIAQLFGTDFFVIKSLYFDKPPSSNWYVAYHQDLTISVDRKTKLDGYGPWTVKHNQFAVQPPVHILENIITVRIHLDETNTENGALKVINGSHLKEIYRPEEIDWSCESETYCKVPKGGVMIMKPLLLHSSGRTTNQKRRRVIHIEFSNILLPDSLGWSELINLNDHLI